MKKFVEYLINSIVEDKESAKITEEVNGGQTNVNIVVGPNDMGIVIGKGGRTIRSIRALLKAKAIKDNVRVNVELVDPYKNDYNSPNSF